jgi:hypothetical protein
MVIVCLPLSKSTRIVEGNNLKKNDDRLDFLPSFLKISQLFQNILQTIWANTRTPELNMFFLL